MRNFFSKVNYNNDNTLFLKNEVLIYAYSASRQIGKLNIGDPSLADGIPSFIDEKTILYDAEEILHTLNYAALDAKEKDKNDFEKYKNRIEKIKKCLFQFFLM